MKVLDGCEGSDERGLVLAAACVVTDIEHLQTARNRCEIDSTHAAYLNSDIGVVYFSRVNTLEFFHVARLLSNGSLFVETNSRLVLDPAEIDLVSE